MNLDEDKLPVETSPRDAESSISHRKHVFSFGKIVLFYDFIEDRSVAEREHAESAMLVWK